MPCSRSAPSSAAWRAAGSGRAPGRIAPRSPAPAPESRSFLLQRPLERGGNLPGRAGQICAVLPNRLTVVGRIGSMAQMTERSHSARGRADCSVPDIAEEHLTHNFRLPGQYLIPASASRLRNVAVPVRCPRQHARRPGARGRLPRRERSSCSTRSATPCCTSRRHELARHPALRELFQPHLVGCCGVSSTSTASMRLPRRVEAHRDRAAAAPRQPSRAALAGVTAPAEPSAAVLGIPP